MCHPVITVIVEWVLEWEGQTGRTDGKLAKDTSMPFCKTNVNLLELHFQLHFVESCSLSICLKSILILRYHNLSSQFLHRHVTTIYL